ncbi:MAG: polyprenyl synthetase family protein [Burkholderiaceae bacterium]|nr:polyprenyl synthetase family protein [Burkholderiaceae bacterium]
MTALATPIISDGTGPDARAAPHDLQDVLRPVAADIDAVDRMIRTRLDSDVALINTIADYIVAAGGKRLRPAVLLLTARALDYRGKDHVELAAVIEFIHTATLLHDDVVDESDLRRGRSTANSMFGNAASVLVGDFLYSRSFQMMVKAGNPRVMQIMADATNRIAEGEVLQLLNVHDPSVNEDRYFEVVERKTATLFEAGCRIAAVIAGADRDVEERCAHYGAALGKAFQIIDDVLDYSGDTEAIGKRLGDDLREGKMTLPLIHALRSAAPIQRDFVTAAVREGRGDFTAVARIVTENGSLEYSRMLARQEAVRAYGALDRLAPTVFKDSLLHLIAFATDRNR